MTILALIRWAILDVYFKLELFGEAHLFHVHAGQAANNSNKPQVASRGTHRKRDLRRRGEG